MSLQQGFIDVFRFLSLLWRSVLIRMFTITRSAELPTIVFAFDDNPYSLAKHLRWCTLRIDGDSIGVRHFWLIATSNLSSTVSGCQFIEPFEQPCLDGLSHQRILLFISSWNIPKVDEVITNIPSERYATMAPATAIAPRAIHGRARAGLMIRSLVIRPPTTFFRRTKGKLRSHPTT